MRRQSREDVVGGAGEGLRGAGGEEQLPPGLPLLLAILRVSSQAAAQTLQRSRGVGFEREVNKRGWN